MLVVVTILTGCSSSAPPTTVATEAQSPTHAPTTATPGGDESGPSGWATTISDPTIAQSAVTEEAVGGSAEQPMGSSRPVRLQIPAIGADSPLLDLGLQADGTMEVPPDAGTVGWFTGGPTPGELGPAVIVGHVDWAGAPGIFYDLRELSAGSEIVITRADGTTAEFEVSSTEQFPKDDFPTAAVYGNIDHAGLRLITCGGSFDPAARSYLDNIVVFAKLV